MDSKQKTEPLSEANVEKNPFRQFEKWYGEAFRLMGEDASAMTLSTIQGKQPDARIVYLRGNDKRGYWFFTNYNSSKAAQLSENPNGCVLFYWSRTGKQVRMKGTVEKLPEKISDNYFRTRPRESQLSAWASPQSRTIANRSVLEEWAKEFEKQFEGKKVPRPSFWGGYRFVPVYFEFWYSREKRLHDRLAFTRQKNRRWKMNRLAP